MNNKFIEKNGGNVHNSSIYFFRHENEAENIRKHKIDHRDFSYKCKNLYFAKFRNLGIYESLKTL